MRTLTLALALLFSFSLGASAAMAQAAPWQTAPGGDPTGDYVSVSRPVPSGTLGGARTVERLTRTTGYTTGSLTTIVLSGSESEDARTITVHLPYGATLDLAQGDAVSVAASSVLLGLGTRHEVRLSRGATLVLLLTSMSQAGGVTIARGAEVGSPGSQPRQFALDVVVDGQHATVRPSQLTLLPTAQLLLSGSEIVYEGGVRPPDAFDTRSVTIVRLAPLPPAQPPTATS
jgi:hypothetical protein